LNQKIRIEKFASGCKGAIAQKITNNCTTKLVKAKENVEPPT